MAWPAVRSARLRRAGELAASLAECTTGYDSNVYSQVMMSRAVGQISNRVGHLPLSGEDGRLRKAIHGNEK